ncbi:hypothetical protein GW17_00032990 [Ensete ventricosum]|nr:hypothetical protein GW17_00032990 [Ensete ventricosum]RZS15482.1 hypothetical protein BHM03_00047325 [Ensete ventricosum]
MDIPLLRTKQRPLKTSITSAQVARPNLRPPSIPPPARPPAPPLAGAEKMIVCVAVIGHQVTSVSVYVYAFSARLQGLQPPSLDLTHLICLRPTEQSAVPAELHGGRRRPEASPHCPLLLGRRRRERFPFSFFVGTCSTVFLRPACLPGLVIIILSDVLFYDAQFFRRFHAAYVDAVSNPFHVPGKKITSKAFAERVSGIVKSFGPVTTG